MLLRRFMKHVTDQNWFAVGLDVIVVIVGIFLGLQVQAWYDVQTERGQKQAYMSRLHEDVQNAALLIAETYQRSTLKNDILYLTSNYFAGTKKDEELGNEHCDAITTSHIYYSTVKSLTTISELTSSGQLAIISDQTLRVLISDYALSVEHTSTIFANLNTYVVPLAPNFPEMIKTGPLTSTGIAGMTGRVNYCNFDAMNESTAFKNSLNENSVRFNRNTSLLKDQVVIIEQLHELTDSLLGITHEEATP